MKIPSPMRQVTRSQTLAGIIILFVYMFLSGAFFVSAEEVLPKENEATSVTLISQNANSTVTGAPTKRVMTEDEVRANRLATILTGLALTDSEQAQTAEPTTLEQKIARKKQDARQQFQSHIDSLKNKKFDPATKSLKDFALEEFQILKEINEGLAFALSQNVDSATSGPQNTQEASYVMTLQDVYIPSDPRLNEQWYLSRIGETEAGMWSSSIPSKNPPIVAVIDAGVDFGHEDLRHAKWQSDTCRNERGEGVGSCNGGYDFVDNDSDPQPSDGSTHGTAVASLIAAGTDNEVGIASLTRGNVQIMSLRVADHGVLETDNVVRAILFAVHNGAKVINMSFAGPTYSYQLEQAIL